MRSVRPARWAISATVVRSMPCSENISVAAKSDRSLYPAHVKGTDTTSTWDVHIGYLPPGRWNEMDRKGPRVRSVVGGHEVRPALTMEPIVWDSLQMTPRWLEEASSSAVAAIEPSLYANRGAAEWHRFLAGAQARGEVALVISMIGSPAPPKTVGLFGPTAGVSLPGAGGFATVGGPRIALATAPTPADGLGRADRDLALRVVNARDSTLPPTCWSPTTCTVELASVAEGTFQSPHS